jgi:hypothetical protein
VPAGGIRKTLHLEKADLIKTAGENVNDMAVVCDTLSKVVVELKRLILNSDHTYLTYLQSLFVILDVVTVDVMVRSNGFPQFRSDNHAGTLGTRTTSEEHNPTAHIHKLRL